MWENWSMADSVASQPGETTRHFVENMKLLREKAGWTQTDLARRMVEAGWEKYTQMTVSRTEKFERPLRLDEAVSLAHLFGTSLSRMFLPSRDSDLVEQLEKSVENQHRARIELKLSLKLWMIARDTAKFLLMKAEQEDIQSLPPEAAQQIAVSIDDVAVFLEEPLEAVVQEVEKEREVGDQMSVEQDYVRSISG
jgi:transcriptional regulator with XRE-family HTH domain